MSGATGGRDPRRAVLLGVVAAVLATVAAFAAVWVVRGRAAEEAVVTEPTAAQAIDRFVAAFGNRDELGPRACPSSRATVLLAADAARDAVRGLRRNGPVQGEIASGSAQARLTATGGRDRAPGLIVVRRRAAGQWCVAALAGPFTAGTSR